MDRQELNRQRKQKKREEKNAAEQAYEKEHEQQRLPVRPTWLAVTGIVLTMLAMYVWTFGL